MTLWKRISLVALGYVAAAGVAAAVVALYVAATSGADRNTYGGMYSFGDFVLFLAVFGVASLPATGYALFLLRGCRPFWNALSVMAALIAAINIAALSVYFAPRIANIGFFTKWAAVTPLLVFVAPVLGLAFLVSSFFAPTRTARIALIGATLAEAIIFIAVVLDWFWGSPAR
jgi:hypothetical protein